MRITKRQLRRIIREAMGDDFFSDREANPHDGSMYGEPEGGYATEHQVGDLVRQIDFEGDGWGGDYEKVVGDQVGHVVEIDEDPDGTQYTVIFPDGTTVMDTYGSFELA